MADLTGQPASVRMRGLQYNNRAYCWDGRSRMKKWDGMEWNNAGIAKDAFTPAVATGAAGVLTGTYKYYVVAVNSKHFNHRGRVVASFPSTLSAAVSPSAQQVTVSAIPATHSDPQVDKWYIYRNRNGYYDANIEDEVQDFYYVGSVNVGVTTYSDNLADDSLAGTDIVRTNQQIPPAWKYGAMFGERLFGCGFDPITTGTATVNATPTLIDFSGVTLPTGIVGCWFKKTADTALYRIESRVSGTQCQLDRAFVGSLSAATYCIFRYPWDVYFSEFMDPEAHGPAGEAFRWRRELPGQDPATGLIAWNGKLIVFSATNIYSIYGKGPNAEDVKMLPDPLFRGLGAVSGDSVFAVDDEVWFMSLRGPARLTPNGPELVGEKLNTDWLDSLNQAEQAIICGGSDGSKAHFCVPVSGDTETSKWFECERSTAAWWERRWANPYFFFNDDGDDGVQGRVYYAQGNHLFEPDAGTTDVMAATYSGTVTTGGTTSFSASAGAFPTASGGLIEAYVHVFRAGVYVGSRRIIANTTTQITWSATETGGGSLTVAIGDTYEIGNVWWTWKTKNHEIPGHAKRELDLHMTFGAVDATKTVTKTDYVNLAAVSASAHTIACSELAKKFSVNERNRDYAVKVESRNGATLRQLVLDEAGKEAEK